MCREYDIYYSRESDMWPVDFVRFFVFGVNSKLPLEAQFLTPDLAQRKDSPFRSNHYTFCAWGRQTQTVDAAISIFLCKSGLLMIKSLNPIFSGSNGKHTSKRDTQKDSREITDREGQGDKSHMPESKTHMDRGVWKKSELLWRTAGQIKYRNMIFLWWRGSSRVRLCWSLRHVNWGRCFAVRGV